MLHVYRQLAHKLGSRTALELAHDLILWHDRMVRHQRTLEAGGGRACDGDDDGCAHVEARELWRRAVAVFGPDASALVFLRRSAAAGAGRRRPPVLTETSKLD